MEANPFKSSPKRAPLRFSVVVHGMDEHHKATRQNIAQTSSAQAAFGRMIDVLKQWANSHGAVHPGTRVTIYDTNDGGKLFDAQYLGFGDTLV